MVQLLLSVTSFDFHLREGRRAFLHHDERLPNLVYIFCPGRYRLGRMGDLVPICSSLSFPYSCDHCVVSWRLDGLAWQTWILTAQQSEQQSLDDI